MPERVFLEEDSLVVTDARLSYKGSTYPLAAVTSIHVAPAHWTEMREHDRTRRHGTRLAVVGGCLVVGSLAVYARSAGAALFMITFGIAAVLGGLRYRRIARSGARVTENRRLVIVNLASDDGFAVPVGSPVHAQQIKQGIDEAIVARETARPAKESSVAEALGKLAVMRDSGVLTADDWERAKDLYLGKRPDEREAAIARLQKLHDLHSDGVLSESEFNMKKWGILSRTEMPTEGFESGTSAPEAHGSTRFR